MKTIKTHLIALIAILLCGCGGIEEEHVTTVKLMVDNTAYTKDGYVVYAEAQNGDEQWIFERHNVPTEAYMHPNMVCEWVSEKTDIGPFFHMPDEPFKFTFSFDNGVKYTFSGDMIENDFRDEDSWTREDKDKSETFHQITYTYKFTDADYERIMALCQQ